MLQWDKGHYLPHQPTEKESGTTGVRPVMHLQENKAIHPWISVYRKPYTIPASLLRFWIHQIGVTADIRKAHFTRRQFQGGGG